MKDILVVDSSKESLELMVELLEQSGYGVSQATTGRAALDHMLQRLANVVLIDDDLPDCTGVELSHRLKAAAKAAWGAECITIAIRGDIERREVADWSGTDHLVLKPLNFDLFDALIADCCDARYVPVPNRRLLQ